MRLINIANGFQLWSVTQACPTNKMITNIADSITASILLEVIKVTDYLEIREFKCEIAELLKFFFKI